MNTPEIINVGTLPNDGTGDPLRTAYQKINNNFSTLFPVSLSTTTANTTGNTANQIIFQYPANAFSQGQLYIQSTNPATPDSQTIILNVQVSRLSDDVTFSGFGTTTFGNAVTSYDVEYNSGSGNVRVLANPLVNANLTHEISSQLVSK